MIARRLRDLARGLPGTYAIEHRLIELRDAIRGSVRPDDLALRLKDSAEIERLGGRLRDVEARLGQLTELAAHTVVRDVGIAFFMGFPSYFFRQDAAFRSMLAGGPNEYIDMSREAAQALVAARIANRRRCSANEVVRSYWSSFNKYDYNALHTPMLAALHEAGVPADFVDVGANVGDTAMAAAEAIEMLGLDASVHSFEPGPVFELARANISLNGLDRRSIVHNVAAGDTSGYLPMQILIGHTESGSVGSILAHYDLPLGETRIVRTVRLDEFLPNDGRSYLIKIDAEGVDFAVVRGASGLIDSGRAPIITLEFMPKYLSSADLATMRALLRDYSLFNLRGLDHGGHFDRFDPVPQESFDTWADAVAASPHGWSDVVLVSRQLVDSAPIAAFREGYEKYAMTRTP